MHYNNSSSTSSNNNINDNNNNILITKFSTLQQQYATLFTFTPRSWYPMRIGGIILLAFTTLFYVVLHYISQYKRRTKFTSRHQQS
jgi:flagellar biosynthesis/type III secretory pathway M-ring protein FliF/YscJ